MNANEVIQCFREVGALLEGHFLYASGRHGRQFLQAARVLQYPIHTEALCQAMAERFRNENVQLVCGPATGGIVLSYETARHLNCPSVFSEKEADGGMAVKRGFRIPMGARVLVVEDIVTTGGSVAKTVAHLRDRGANVIGVGVLIDRSKGEARFDCRFEALAELAMESWEPSGCTLCREGKPLIDPDDIKV